MQKHKLFFLFLLCFLCNSSFSQNISSDSSQHSEKVFSSSKILNSQSTETIKKGSLLFTVSERSGSIDNNSGSAHSFFGLDQLSDLRLAIDYGISNKLQAGIGRSKYNELIDASVKWKFLEQSADKKNPVSISLFGSAGLNPQKETVFYPANVIIPNKGIFAHRLSYFSQVMISRKFSERISLQLTGSWQHRNFIVEYSNADNGKKETNELFSAGLAGKIKLTKRFNLLADYFYLFSGYRTKNSANPYENPLAIGLEFISGTQIFRFTFTNTSSVTENNFIPNTQDRWLKGGFRFGFSFSGSLKK